MKKPGPGQYNASRGSYTGGCPSRFKSKILKNVWRPKTSQETVPGPGTYTLSSSLKIVSIFFFSKQFFINVCSNPNNEQMDQEMGENIVREA